MSGTGQRLAAAITAAVLTAMAGCGGAPAANSSGGGGGGGTLNGTPASYVYAGQNNIVGATISGQVLTFAARMNGAATPTSTLNVPMEVDALAVDSGGQIYVGGYLSSNNSAVIQIFAAGATGNAVPIRTIVPANAYAPESMAVDSSQNLYTVDGMATINVYPAGKTVPSRTITGTATTLANPVGVALDSTGNIYVTNLPASFINPTILEFASTANGNVAPAKTISYASTTGVLLGIAVDSLGNIYAGLDNTTSPYTTAILVYSSSQSGAAAPIRTISGSSTQLVTGGQIDVDAAGNIYVANQIASTTGLPSYSLLQFSSAASGNVAPSAVTTSSLLTAAASQIAIR